MRAPIFTVSQFLTTPRSTCKTMNHTHRLYGCSHVHSRFITENTADVHWWNMKRCLCQELKERLVVFWGVRGLKALVDWMKAGEDQNKSEPAGETCWCEKPHLTGSAVMCLGIKGITHPKLTFYPFSPLCHRRPWWHYQIKNKKQKKPNMSPYSNSDVNTIFWAKISAVGRSHAHVNAHDIGENVVNVITPYVPHEYLYTSCSPSLSLR